MEGRTRISLYVLERSSWKNQRIETEISVPAESFKCCLQSFRSKNRFIFISVLIKLYRNDILKKLIFWLIAYEKDTKI